MEDSRRSIEDPSKIDGGSFEDQLKIIRRSIEDLSNIDWGSFEDLLEIHRISLGDIRIFIGDYSKIT